MFGMGFMEILLVVIVAIIALGPEKLPSAMVDVAKFFKKMKSGLEDAKSTIDQELNISEMKKEAQEFKSNFEQITDGATEQFNDIVNLDDEPQTKKETTQNNKPRVDSYSEVKKENTEQTVAKKETINFNDKVQG